MSIELSGAEEIKNISDKTFEKRKKKEIKHLLRDIKKEIAHTARQGHYKTQVYIKKYLEEDVVSLLISKGYEVEQVENYGSYMGNPPYIVSWEDKGE